MPKNQANEYDAVIWCIKSISSRPDTQKWRAGMYALFHHCDVPWAYKSLYRFMLDAGGQKHHVKTSHLRRCTGRHDSVRHLQKRITVKARWRQKTVTVVHSQKYADGCKSSLTDIQEVKSRILLQFGIFSKVYSSCQKSASGIYMVKVPVDAHFQKHVPLHQKYFRLMYHQPQKRNPPKASAGRCSHSSKGFGLFAYEKDGHIPPPKASTVRFA